jgi:photosystem II stability/assembly factor-like uncharacterized protein
MPTASIRLTSSLPYVLLATILSLASLPSTTNASTTTPSSTWLNPLPQGNNIGAISCAGSRVCYAAGDFGAILSSTDHGSTWSSITSDTHADLSAITCPAINTCAVLTPTSFRLTSNRGATWRTHTFPKVDTPTGIVCPTASTCDVWAINEARTCRVPDCNLGPTFNIFGTRDAGRTWRHVHVPSLQYLYAFTCTSSSHCLLAGDKGAIYQTWSSGKTWKRVLSIHHNPYGQVLTCPTTRNCHLAVTLNNNPRQYTALWLTTTNGGVTWSKRRLPNTGYNDVSCLTASTCFMSTNRSVLLGTRNGGASWRSYHIPIHDAYQFACQTTQTCHIIGPASQIMTTQNGGSTWKSSVTGPIDDLLHISCPAVTTCFALTANASLLITFNSGATWELRATPLKIHNGDRPVLSCPTTHVCVLAGSNAAIVRTDDAGLHWTNQHNPLTGTTVPLDAVSCATSQMCIAAGTGCPFPHCKGPHTVTAILRTANGGSTWSQAFMRRSSFLGLTAVACPTTQECFASGSVGTILPSRDGGKSWQAPQSVPPDYGSLDAISCANASYCVAVGSGCAYSGGCAVTGFTAAIETTTDGGHTWITRNRRIPITIRDSFLCGPVTSCASSASLAGVSCPTSTTCWAAGTNGTILRTSDAGATWTQQPRITDTSFSGIACPTPTTCYAAGPGGTIIRTTSP